MNLSSIHANTTAIIRTISVTLKIICTSKLKTSFACKHKRLDYKLNLPYLKLHLALVTTLDLSAPLLNFAV
jgi:hypothetical protein